jgi:DNA-directed RNA polymerase subunit beta
MGLPSTGANGGQLVDDMKDVDGLRKKLSEIVSPEEYKAILKDMADAELLGQARLMRNGVPMASPVFDGANEEEIKKCLVRAGLPVTGQATLYDGRTGQPFDQQVTVGVLYVMKLHHLVDDCMPLHGPLPGDITTLGTAQFGGQRLGEMEVWAMEAYGAAYSLQEFLTVKSDDVAGRTRMYERIVKGNNVLEPGLPESFKVLLKELLALALEVQLFEDSQA